MSNYSRAKAQAVRRRLRRGLSKRYQEREAEQIATALEGGRIKLGGQSYPAQGISASPGTQIAVKNLGRLGLAYYGPADGAGATISAGAGTSTTTGGGGGAEDFLDLTDTPATYTGAAGRFVRVDSTPGGLQFGTIGDGDLSATTVVFEADTATIGDGLAGTTVYGAGTLSVVASDLIDTSYGLEVVDNDIRVKLAGTSALEFESGGLRLKSALAGAGLSLTSQVLGVALKDSGSALELVGGKLSVASTIAGGALSWAGGILSVAPGHRLEIDGDTIGLEKGAGAYQALITAIDGSASWQNLSGFAGDGLSWDVGFDVNANKGLVVESDAVTINKAYNFTGADAWTGSHLFSGSEVKITSSSYLVDTDMVFVGSQSLKSNAGTITIEPFESLILDGVTRTKETLRSDHFASGVTGWGINYEGSADFRILTADELRVKLFIADLEQALAGSQIIAKSVAILEEDFSIPVPGGTATLTVKAFPGYSSLQVFAAGDHVVLRTYNRDNGGLFVGFVFGTVSNPNVNEVAGTQTWTFTRLSGSDGGLQPDSSGTSPTETTTGGTIEAGSLALDFGVSGDGYYEVTTLDAFGSPYWQIVTWDTHPWYDRTVNARGGNLDGIFSGTDEYGLYAGTGTAVTDSYLRLSNQEVSLNNLPLYLRDDTEIVIALEPGTNPYMALGSPIPDGYNDAGVWMGRHTDGSYRFSINNNGTEYIRWTGSSLEIAGNINILNPEGISTSTLNNDEGWITSSALSPLQGDINAAASEIESINTTLTAQGEAIDTKIVAYWQDTEPVTGEVNDIWFDTNDGNKVYRCTSESPLTWTVAQDSDIATALANAQTAQNTADDKIVTYWQASAPSTGLTEGDLWIDTDDFNKIYRWNGSIWQAAEDSRVETGLDANGNVVTSLLPSTPIAESPSSSGFYVGSNYLGFYNGDRWATFMDNTGDFWLRGVDNPIVSGHQGLFWDASEEALNISGALTLYDGSGNSVIALDPSTPHLALAQDATAINYYAGDGAWMGLEGGSPAFRVGDPNGDYISYIDGVLTVRGNIIVTDGDLIVPKYRVISNMSSVQTEYESAQDVQFIPADPHDYGNGICGKVTMADGSIYWLQVDTASSLFDRTGSRSGYLTIKKGRDAGDSPSAVGSVNYPDETNATGYSPVVTVYAYSIGDFDLLSNDDEENRIILADLWMSSDISSIDSIVWRSPSQLTVITPDYISTPNLSSIKADLGIIDAGSIEITSRDAQGNPTNKMWLNVGDDTLKLAIGGLTRTSAPFRVYEDGDLIVGNTAAEHLHWNGSSLAVKGTITADAGTLGTLAVSGTLSVGASGKLAWNGGASYINSSKVEITESGSTSIVRIGDGNQTDAGLIDIDMFAQAGSTWNYGVHITDGGNQVQADSALFHGRSEINGINAIDRIFDAYTNNAAFSDGYYADMSGGQSLGNNDYSGVAFKGTSRGGQPLAVFNQASGTLQGPVVVSKSSLINSALYEAVVSANGQTGFKVNYTGGANTVALDAGDNRIEKVLSTDMKIVTQPSYPPDGYARLYFDSFGNGLYILYNVGGSTFKYQVDTTFIP